MKTLSTFRLAAVFCAPVLLAACNTAGTAPTGMTPATTVATSGMATATPTNFLNAFNPANAQLATSTPVTGTANYKGQVEVHTTQSTTDPDNVVFGDVNMDVNFNGAANPITATVSNISGRIGGVDTQVTGTLTSAGSAGINQVLALPVGGGTSTGIAVQVEGALADPTGTLTGSARMAINGTARGANAASLVGANSVIISDANGVNKLATGGRFYANK